MLYEIKFTPTEEDVYEYVAQTLPERSLLSALICCVIVFAVGALWWLLIDMDVIINQVLHLIPAVFLVFAVVFTDLKLKQAALNRSVKRYMVKNKTALAERGAEFYEGRFVSGGKSYEYPAVSKVLYGSSCMYLLVGEGEAIMIKDADAAFICGGREEFWDFLNSKVTVKEEPKKNPLKLFRS